MACEALAHVGDGRAPFARGVIVDWYDGAVSGVATCAGSDTVYAFRLAAWDHDQHQRVFVLRSIPRTALTELEAIFSPATGATPAWLVASRFASEAERDEAWRRANAVLNRAGPIEYLVLTSDIAAAPAAARPVAPGSDRDRIEAMLAEEPNEADGYAYSEQPFDVWLALFAAGGTPSSG
jgi:hypothetical protein